MVEKIDIALLIIRLILGLALTLHGAQKAFGLFGGDGLDNWINYITTQTIPYTNTKFKSWMASLSAYLEFIVGIFILFGIFIKYSSILSVLFLVVAIKLAHCGKGYFSQKGGYEYAINLIGLSLVLLLLGGGKYQVYTKNDL